MGRSEDVPRNYDHYPTANVAEFTVEARLADDQPAQVEVFAVSEGGIGYRGVFPISSDENALSAASSLCLDSGDVHEATQPAGVLSVEHPRLENGVAVLRDRQQFRLAGWAVASENIERLNVLVDGRFVGEADYGTLRKDVADAFPEWPHAAHSGFSLQLAERYFLQNPSTISVEAQLMSGGKVSGTFQLWFGEEEPAAWGPRNEALMSDEEIWRFARTLRLFAHERVNEIVADMQAEATLRGDPQRALRAQHIKDAVGILGAAWAQKPIDQKLATYLRDRGYS
jgi:hypothetical protein